VRVWVRVWVLTGDARGWWVVVGVVIHERMCPAHNSIVAHARVERRYGGALSTKAATHTGKVCDRASHTHDTEQQARSVWV
jgi:diaminopimelate decarboxylase